MNSDKADQIFNSDDTPAANTPRVDETGQQLEQSGWKVKANAKADVTRNIRRRDDSSSTCEKVVDTNGGGLTKRKRLSDSLPSCEDAEGASERHSCERHRTGDSSSSSEEVEEESGEESRSGQRAYDSSSSCEETEQESGGVREMQCNISILQQNRWESMFARLIEFKEEHGHCLVPNRFEEDRSLGAWVSTQRRHYKLMFSKDADHGSTPLTKERIQKLQDVGFVWATSDPRHTPWDVRFNELRAYRETYGDALVPIGYAENIQLSNWVSTQRQGYRAFREGRPTRMTQERIDQLESIGMVWDAQRGGNRQRGGRSRPITNGASAADSLLSTRVENNHLVAGALRGGAASQRTTQVRGEADSTAGSRAQERSWEPSSSALPGGFAPNERSVLARSVAASLAPGPFLPSGQFGPAGLSMTNNNRHWTPESLGSVTSRSIHGLLDPALFVAATSPNATLQALSEFLGDPYAMAHDVATSNVINARLRNFTASVAGSLGAQGPAMALNRTNQLLAYRHLQSAAEQSILLNRAQTPLDFGLSSAHGDVSRLILARYGIPDPASALSATDISGGHSLLGQYDAARLMGMNRGGFHASGDIARSQFLQSRIAAASILGSRGASLETALNNMMMDRQGAAGRRTGTRQFQNETEAEESESDPPSDGK